MQLDRTHLKIRIRRISEIGDLALVMIRRYPRAITVGFLVGALPWIIADMALLSWIPIREAELGLNDAEAGPELARYQVWMALLVFLQTPAAGIPATYYLGQAVFEEKPTWSQVFREVRKRFWSWFMILGVVRLPVIAMMVVAIGIGQPVHWFVDGLAPMIFLLAAWLVRGSRPFLPEILLLEQCPVRVKKADRSHTLSAGVRSNRLHNPLSGELNGRFLVIGIAAVVLASSLYFTLSSLTTLLTGNQLNQGLFPLLVLYPITLWAVAGISVVVRLLNYLDSRIRLEGWDVELAVRAEALRQFGESVPQSRTVPTSGSVPKSGPVLSASKATITSSLVFVLAMGIAGSVSAQPVAGTPAILPLQSPPAAVTDSPVLVEESPWFDAGTGSVRPVEVENRSDDTIHRESRWLPKAKKVKKAAKSPPPPGAAGTPPAMGGGGGLFGGGLTIANVFGWLALLLALGCVMGLLYYLLGRFDPERANAAAASQTRRPAGIDEQTIERISQLPKELRRTDVNMRTEAERLMHDGNFELAIILLLGHQLLLCDRAGMLRLNRGKTNGRYVREVRASDLRSGDVLQRTTAAFDRSFFGEHPPTSDEFASLWKDNGRLESYAQSLLEAVA